MKFIKTPVKRFEEGYCYACDGFCAIVCDGNCISKDICVNKDSPECAKNSGCIGKG
ncbi:hypothetical protein GCM10008904_00800 [Paraclostridium ghonii]|uniref:Cys-rich peptide (Clo7bot family) n=1 Tax=Paraclostridium ghonii TaxID=29358 RepID=A0ABU0N487_9FIRM|nr:hypothetical protein [Paeniclostridium ghonii]MDQ0557962.1 Cys-rich peptide (Clo7bot family) [Paeniclostridium ghonii]